MGKASSSWIAFLLFYVVMLVVTMVLDSANGLLSLGYVAVQAGLISLGVAVFALVGWRVPKLTAEQSVMLAFVVGVFTIIPAILMSLGELSGFWPSYFLVALGMIGGSILGFVFVRLVSSFAHRADENKEPTTED